MIFIRQDEYYQGGFYQHRFLACKLNDMIGQGGEGSVEMLENNLL